MTPQANKSVNVFTYSAQLYQDEDILRTFGSISLSLGSTNLRIRQLWDKNVFTTALHSPNQAEK